MESCEDYEDPKEVVSCYADEYGLDGSVAARVAFCESTWDPAAKNTNSTATGLFQHLGTYWPERVDRFDLPSDFDIYDVHDNTVMAMELAKADGWERHWYPSAECWS